MSLLNKLAAFKSSPRFTFDYLHTLIAYAVITTAVWKWGLNLWLSSLIFYITILLIEWVFDTRYEKATPMDNLRDCLDYLVGTSLAILVIQL